MSDLEGFQSWDEHKMADYLKAKAKLGEYHELLIKHKVTGVVAPSLTDADLKEMGIENIGDRKMFMKALEDLKKESRKAEREKVIWEADELLFFSCWDKGLGTCCGCCPVNASEYKLTGTHLVIKKADPCRCGPCICPCNMKYEIDNTDLTNVTDADVKGVPAPCLQQVCCCGESQDHIVVKTRDGDKILKVAKGEGEVVARKITNQVEEAQKIERD